MTKLVAMFAALGVGGCSFIGVRGPPSPLPTQGMVTCSDSYVAPIIDSIFGIPGVLGLLAGIYFTAKDPNVNDYQGGPGVGRGPLLIFTGIVVGLPYGISALYGHSRVSRCNDANGPARQRRVADDTAALARAESLTNAAVLAARNGDCASTQRLDAQLMQLDPDLHETLFHDPAITRCLTTIEMPSPYCFVESTGGKVTTACMPSQAECLHAIEMLSLGSGSTCVKAPEN